MYQQLFIPGPISVRSDVLQKMASPMIGHRSAECTQLQESISGKLQTVFQTKNTMVLSTSSGSGLMESAVRCCTSKHAAIFSVGAFGDRWHKMAASNNKSADLFRASDGQATSPSDVEKALSTGKYDLITITHNETSSGVMNPVAEIAEVIANYPDVIFCLDTVSSMAGVDIPVDQWGVDFCITSTQKCLGLPPGLAIASVSDRAYEKAKTVENRGVYLDIVEIVDKVKKNYQYPSTPSLPHMFALNYQLDNILAEGIENRWTRHAQMAEYVQNWARQYFALFADESHLSSTVTCVANKRGISVSGLNQALAGRGMTLSNGYGNLKEQTFRIAHMGDYTLADVKKITDAVVEILGL